MIDQELRQELQEIKKRLKEIESKEDMIHSFIVYLAQNNHWKGV